MGTKRGSSSAILSWPTDSFGMSNFKETFELTG